MCRGCYAELPEASLRQAPCSDCGVACPACADCAAGAEEVTCEPCFELRAFLLGEVVRRRMAAKLN